MSSTLSHESPSPQDRPSTPPSILSPSKLPFASLSTASSRAGDSPTSARDSGVEDMHGSPTPKSRKTKVEIPQVQVTEQTDFSAGSDEGREDQDQTGNLQACDTENTSGSEIASGKVVASEDARIIADDPFENEESRIMFDAIDKLQSWQVSEFLTIPQVSVAPKATCKW